MIKKNLWMREREVDRMAQEREWAKDLMTRLYIKIAVEELKEALTVKKS